MLKASEQCLHMDKYVSKTCMYLNVSHIKLFLNKIMLVFKEHMHTYTYTQIHTDTNMHTCRHTQTHADTPTYTQAYTHIHTGTNT